MNTNQSSITGTRGLSLMVQWLRLHTPNAGELRSHRLHRAAEGRKKMKETYELKELGTARGS